MTNSQTPAALAGATAEAVRQLTSVTISTRDGWRYPGDAYAVTGSLLRAVGFLGQLYGQIDALIEHLDRDDRLTAPEGQTVQYLLAEIHSGLRQGSRGAGEMRHGLTLAADRIGRLAYRFPNTHPDTEED